MGIPQSATSALPRVARVYLRVSTDSQDLARQEAIVATARGAGYYVAAVYRETASGARPDRPELVRMIADLQPGEVVIAEKIDRISRLPLPEAEQLVAAIRAKGARLAVPGIVDLSDLVADSSGVAHRETYYDLPMNTRARGGALYRAQGRRRPASPHPQPARSGHEHRAHRRARRVQRGAGQARDGAAPPQRCGG